MENIKNINLKDIKDNIYVLEVFEKQIYINNVYFDIKKDYIIFNYFINKILSKYNNFNFINNINLNNYFYYGLKNTKNNLIFHIFNIINFYIFYYDKEKENLYLEILYNNLICYSKDDKKLNNFYFKKEIFEELFLKLNLNCKIIIKYLNTKDKIININNININNTKEYILNNNDIIYEYNDKSMWKEYYNKSIKNEMDDNFLNFLNEYNNCFTYKEILIINCNNKNNLLDLDFKEDINFNNLDKNINYDEQIKELKEEIEKLKIENNKLKIENNKLKEYKNKFEKINLFFKN